MFFFPFSLSFSTYKQPKTFYIFFFLIIISKNIRILLFNSINSLIVFDSILFSFLRLIVRDWQITPFCHSTFKRSISARGIAFHESTDNSLRVSFRHQGVYYCRNISLFLTILTASIALCCNRVRWKSTHKKT